MAITSVDVFGKLNTGHLRLDDIKEGLQVIKEEHVGKPWDEMTAIQKIFCILTFGLWRPEFNIAEKAERHNLIANLFTQLYNLTIHSTPSTGEPVALRIGGESLMCEVDNRGYTLSDHRDSVFLSYEEFETMRNVLKIVPEMQTVCYRLEPEQPFAVTVKSMTTLGEVIRIEDPTMMPCQHGSSSVIKQRDITGSMSADVFRAIGKEGSWTVQGVRISGEVIRNILSGLDKDGTEQKVLPSHLPTSLFSAQVTEALEPFPLSADERQKVIDTLTTPGAFEMLIIIMRQGLLGKEHVRATLPMKDVMETAPALDVRESWYGSSLSTYSVDVQDMTCRAVSRSYLPVPIDTGHGIQAACVVTQAEVSPRPGGKHSEYVSLNPEDSDCVGLGMPITFGSAYILIGEEQQALN